MCALEGSAALGIPERDCGLTGDRLLRRPPLRLASPRCFDQHAGDSLAADCEWLQSGRVHPTCKVKAPTPTYGWTMGDYYNVSWRFGLAFLTPQIYFTGQATQWRWISTYGSSFSGQIQPYGPMITPGYLSASTAWNDLQAYFPGIAYILTIRSE
jgi:hypothetical protein